MSARVWFAAILTVVVSTALCGCKGETISKPTMAAENYKEQSGVNPKGKVD